MTRRERLRAGLEEARAHWPALMLALLVPVPLLVEVLGAELPAVRVVGAGAYVVLVFAVHRSSGSFLAIGATVLVVAWTSSDPVSPGSAAPLVGLGVVVVALAADRWERRSVAVTAAVRSERRAWTVFGSALAVAAAFAISQLLDLPERSMGAALVGAVGLLVVSVVVLRLGDGELVGRAVADQQALDRLLSDRRGRRDPDADRGDLGGHR